MDVSNNTGDETRYRVTSGGGGTSQGRLAPRDYNVVVPPKAGPWKVEFFQGDKLIAKEVVNSPKASVTITAGQDGTYRVQSSVPVLDAFITYTPSERSWAENLDAVLRGNGVSVWLDTRDLKPGTSWQAEIEKAIQESRNIIVLIGPESEDAVGERQRFEWMAALEAVWRDSNKRLIPLLLPNATLPSFVRSAVSGEHAVVVVRVEDLHRDWNQAVADLVRVLKSEVDLREKGNVLDTAEEDRHLQRERLSYIKRAAQSLRDAQ